MKLWQKNFLFAALLFMMIFYICVFFLAAPPVVSYIQNAKNAAVSEEYAISRALDSVFNSIKKESHKNAAASFAVYYKKRGVYLEIGSETDILFSALPYPASPQIGTLSWVKYDKDTHINITDQLSSGYYLVYMRSVNEIVDASMKQGIVSAVVGTGVVLVLCILLYFTLKKVNLPIDRLAHEMRTPLTAISGYAQALMISNLSEKQRYYATQYILDESKRLSEISEKLLTIADMRRRSIKKERVDIEELFLRARRTYGRVKYTVKWKEVMGDSVLLQSLINNLVANALKASPDEGIIELTAQDRQIIVRDYGKGMSEEQLDYVNNPKKDNPFNRSGLGVPLCHEIVRLHKAGLYFTSEEGKGTKATISFTT